MQRFAKSAGVIGLICCLALPGAAFAVGSGDDGDADARLRQAVEAVEKQDYRKAISLLEQVLEDDSGHADALNYLGYSYRKLGNYERALTYYRRALQVNPDHEGANEYIGEAYLELKQPDNAKAHLDRLASICGTSCDAYRDLKKAFDAYQAKARGS
jgi:tetratricopeptide (TPR) repeat protein